MNDINKKKILKYYQQLIKSLNKNENFIPILKNFKKTSIENEIQTFVSSYIQLKNVTTQNYHDIPPPSPEIKKYRKEKFYSILLFLVPFGILKTPKLSYVEDIVKNICCIWYEPDIKGVSENKSFSKCVKCERYKVYVKTYEEEEYLLTEYKNENDEVSNAHPIKELTINMILNLLNKVVCIEGCKITPCSNFVYSHIVTTDKTREHFYNLTEFIDISLKDFLMELNERMEDEDEYSENIPLAKKVYTQTINFMFVQILYALYCSKKILDFEHKDLHLGNIRIKIIDDENFDGFHFIFNEHNIYKFNKNFNFLVKIIDFGLSEINLYPIFNNTNDVEQKYLKQLNESKLKLEFIEKDFNKITHKDMTDVFGLISFFIKGDLYENYEVFDNIGEVDKTRIFDVNNEKNLPLDYVNEYFGKTSKFQPKSCLSKYLKNKNPKYTYMYNKNIKIHKILLK